MTLAASRRSSRSEGRETPIRRQYQALRAQYPDCILLFQLGDFFETFEEDARTVARVCGVTLTSREFGKGDRVPLAGVPVSRLDHYLARLIEAGLRVAIAEQITLPGDGLVERVVTRVVTAGTVAEPGLLREKENNYLAAVVRGRCGAGLAYVDVTTGEFAVTQLEGDDAALRLRAELERLAPAEILVPEGDRCDGVVTGRLTTYERWRSDEATARERLCVHLGVLSLEGFGCAALPLAVQAAAVILSYLEENNRRLLANLHDLRTYSTDAGMILDGQTRRHLELVRNGRTGRVEGSLLAVLDRTRTPMGGRLLRRWLSKPLVDREEIEARLAAVASLVELEEERRQLRVLLGRIGDLERQTARVVQGLASPRELLGLAEALRTVAALRDVLDHLAGPGRAASERSGIGEPDGSAREEGSLATGALDPSAFDHCPEVVDLVERGIAPPGGGRVVRPGFSAELDALIEGAARARRRMADLEQTERQRTGIRSLKVGYNKVFGYFLEVTRPNLALVPADYLRKQTLVQAERFVTSELKEWENELLRTEERIAALEAEVVAEIVRRIAACAPRLRQLARVLAELDVFAALAELARERGYCRPIVDASRELRIRGARHPVVETSLDPGAFIPNDCALDPEGCTIMLLTGPNMSGKSTYLREIALIVLLAQIGSFVPAAEARIGLVDRIFTRVGAQDDIAAGASTFMVEMMETASILRHATARSLILLDEIGRGTSTFDGLSIAQAVVEEIHDRIGARTLFATHFHELAEATRPLDRLRVFSMAVTEEGGEVIFLRTVVAGAADRSYGIHVARLAGLPPRVTRRAEEILQRLETPALDVSQPAPWCACPVPVQLPLPGIDCLPSWPANLLAELLALDPANLTPLEALSKIWELHRRAGRP